MDTMKKFILFAVVCVALSTCLIAAFAPIPSFNTAPLPLEIASNNPSSLSPVALANTPSEAAEASLALDLPGTFQTLVHDVVFRVAVNAKRVERKFHQTFAVLGF